MNTPFLLHLNNLLSDKIVVQKLNFCTTIGKY